MKEELINKILERGEFRKEDLECLDEVVLERLVKVADSNILKQIIKIILNLNLDYNIILMYIDICEINLKIIEHVDIIVTSNLSSDLKVRALKKLVQAKYDFQGLYIKSIYQNEKIQEKELLADIILSCKTLDQVATIYIMFSEIEDDINLTEYYALAKLITKCHNIYKTSILNDHKWLQKMLNLGLLLPIANLILKCKTNKQADYIKLLLYNQSNKKNAPYVIKYSEYFLKTTDENKLNSIFKYLTYCLKQNLLVEVAKVNLIINARNKFNSDAIEDLLTYGKLIDTNLESEAAQILNDSRKEYNANYASKLIYDASVDSLSGAMIVNESETRYKAQKVYNTIYSYAITDEIDKSLEFAALINSVHTKLEIDLIYLLSQNSYLNKLGIALPIARVIANATDCEEDVIKIWECLKEEENKINAIKGFIFLIRCIDLKDYPKAENIINIILLKAQNKPIHFELPQEESTSAKIKIPAKIKKLVKKNK